MSCSSGCTNRSTLGSLNLSPTAARAGKIRTSAGTWSSTTDPPPDNVSLATRQAVQRALTRFDQIRFATLHPPFQLPARAPREPAGDSVLSDLQTSITKRDSAGTWQRPENWDPDVYPILCTACSPSKSSGGKNFLYFKSLDAWRLHALHCRKVRAHLPADDCFRPSLPGDCSLPGDRVRAGVWYCSQCHPRTHFAQLFGATLETQMARRKHYIKVHDGGAVIALPDCSEEVRLRIQACRQTEPVRATFYDTDSDAEVDLVPCPNGESCPVSLARWWSGAALPVFSPADQIAEEPFVAPHCGSRRRTPARVHNCSLSEAARRQDVQAYAQEAKRQIQAYVNGTV